ncbi:hypothetical protein BDQ17DRAFT_1407471 [Cyathus striatus]|nr:hypothetical protein BDQ17DRAFT_1407471 [Cyathus striatus]
MKTAVPVPKEEVKAKKTKEAAAARAPAPSKKASEKPQKAPTKAVQSTATKSAKLSKKAKANSPSPAPVSEDDADDEDEEEKRKTDYNVEESSDDGADDHLHGFSTDDDDSSDDEAMNDDPLGVDVAKLPTIAKDDATVKRKLEQAKRQPTEDRGVLFLGRIPHGFYEDQLKAYFAQFGEVTRLRISRNKKTGKSKHYGFIEFDSFAVAKIVAETMDNYLLMGHILRCKLVHKDEVHPELWIGANKKWRPVPKDRLVRAQHNKPRTEEQKARAAGRLLKRQNQRKRKLQEAGINYDLDNVKYKKTKMALA